MRLNYLSILSTLLFLCCASVLRAQSVQVHVSQQQIPVLTNKSVNPLISITCIPDGQKEKIEQLKLTFMGTTKVKDITKIYVAKNDKKIMYQTDLVHNNMIIPINQVISDTTTYIVYCDIDANTSLLNTIDAQCKTLYTSNGKVTPTDTTNLRQRVGIAVQDHKWENVNTFRIPGIATTNNGTLLGVYDARRESARDLQGHMDIGVSRSCDGGATWEPMRVALDMKEWGNLPEKFNGVSDAGILVDKNTGTIWVAGLWMHGILDQSGKWMQGLDKNSKAWRHQWHGTASQPGLTPYETCQFLLTKSDDDGKTWSEPINITEQTKRAEWWLFAPAPGNGITMSDGTLVFPTQGRDKDGLPFSNITYSKDGGKTWVTSNPSYSNTTECSVVELSNGTLMLNMRDNRNGKNKGDDNGRAIFTTTDMGNTWTKHQTSHGALRESVCMASLYKHNYGGKSVLLFSNPDSKYHRHHMTIKVSKDNGNTWNKGLLLDEGYSYGYSCLTSVSEKLVGILYEGSRAQMTFQVVPLKELLQQP
ncbi:MAG: exo-alpha-sialidase [Marinifilaceae bacterium]